MPISYTCCADVKNYACCWVYLLIIRLKSHARTSSFCTIHHAMTRQFNSSPRVLRNSDVANQQCGIVRLCLTARGNAGSQAVPTLMLCVQGGWRRYHPVPRLFGWTRMHLRGTHSITQMQIKPITTWFFMCTGLISLARLPNRWARSLIPANYPSKTSKPLFWRYNHPIFWLGCLLIKSWGQVQWLWSYHGSYMLAV
jgi:hypothetical protein